MFVFALIHLLIFTQAMHRLAVIHRTADSRIPVTPTSISECAQMLGLPAAKACEEEDFIRLRETQREF